MTAAMILRATRYHGLSTDTKPTDCDVGSTFFEYNTGSIYSYTGSDWVLKTPPDHLFSLTTIDLNQIAGSYDLYTVGASSVQVLEFGLIIPADLTGAAAGALTGITVQSTDDTPLVIIGATAGLKANLTALAHLTYNGAGVVAATKKIQLTIVDGATTAAQVCKVWLKYQEVS